MTISYESEPLCADLLEAGITRALAERGALPGEEVARVLAISNSTATAHLDDLIDGGMVEAIDRQGFRCYRIASAGHMFAVAAWPPAPAGPRHRPVGRASPEMCFARTCYGHLAGRLGVTLTDRLEHAGFIAGDGTSFFSVTALGEFFFRKFGFDFSNLRKKKQPLARQCLDWTERRPHLGGALGLELTRSLSENGWVVCSTNTRATRVTRAGTIALKRLFGVDTGSLEQAFFGIDGHR